MGDPTGGETTLREGSDSLSQQTERAVRERIIAGVYKPGDRLVERDLSEALGVSRVPVREALRQLEHQGFVETRRGAVVRSMSLRDIDELFDLRIALDRMAAEQAGRLHADGESHEGLATAMAIAEAATETRDAEGILRANAAFHDELFAASGNALLRQVAGPVQARTRWLFAITADRDPVEQCREHRQIFDAIRTGNASLAGWLAAAHVETGRAPSLATLTPDLDGAP
jgi:DNA-binding GntR family transcriptional regulator